MQYEVFISKRLKNKEKSLLTLNL